MVQKDLCPQRESPAGSMVGGRWQSGGLCVCVSVCVYSCMWLCFLESLCMQRLLCHIQYSWQARLRIPKQPVWEYTDATASPYPPHPLLLLQLLCSVFSLCSPHIWSTVSTSIPLTKLIFVSNGGLSLNKTFVSRARWCVLIDKY